MKKKGYNRCGSDMPQKKNLSQAYSGRIDNNVIKRSIWKHLYDDGNLGHDQVEIFVQHRKKTRKRYSS